MYDYIYAVQAYVSSSEYRSLLGMLRRRERERAVEKITAQSEGISSSSASGSGGGGGSSSSSSSSRLEVVEGKEGRATACSNNIASADFTASTTGNSTTTSNDTSTSIGATASTATTATSTSATSLHSNDAVEQTAAADTTTDIRQQKDLEVLYKNIYLAAHDMVYCYIRCIIIAIMLYFMFYLF